MQCLQALYDRGSAHPGANAHAHHTILLALALELREQCGDLTGAGAAEGVAQCDGPTLGVEPALGDAKRLHAVRGLIRIVSL